MERVGHVDWIRREIRAQQGWLVPLGILLMVLGSVAIVCAFAATLATVLLFGALLLIGGAAQLAHALTHRSDHVAWEVATSLLYAVAGLLLVSDPATGAIGLTLLLAAFFLFIGITRISLGLRIRRAYGVGGAYVLAGVLDLALGVLILLGWPGTAAWVIGLFLGIELVVAGIALLLVTASVHHATAGNGSV
jgi:uncharacterized membrane protein HdeD (DUF308 family)